MGFLLILGYLIAIISLSTIALIGFEKRIRVRAVKTLEARVSATHDIIRNLWAEDQISDTAMWASDPELIEIIENLLDLSSSREAILASYSLVELRDYFRGKLKIHDHLGMDLIAPDYRNIASMYDDEVVGSMNSAAARYGDRLAKVFKGVSQIIPPLISDRVFLNVEEDSITNYPVMFVASPVVDKVGIVIAALIFSLDPLHDFTKITYSGFSDDSGETYIFSKSGRLLTESRFTDQLQEIGLLEEGQFSMLNIEIRNPGGNMPDGYIPALPRDQHPLTIMAEKAITGFSGSSAEAYPDYRGVPVLGAWLWDDELEMGFASEIDEKEVLLENRNIKQLTMVVLFIGILLAAAFSTMLQRIQIRLNGTIVQGRKELEIILNGAIDAIITINERGIIELFSKAGEEMFGYSADEVIGKNVSILAPEPFRSKHDSYIQNYLISGKAKIIGRGRDITAVRKDCSTFPARLSVSEEFINEKHIFIGIIHDTTEYKETEEKLISRSKELEGMNKALIKSRKAAMSLMQDARIQKEKADGALTELQKSTAEFNKLSRAIERSPVSVVITDEKGSIEYVNPHFSKTTGYQPEDVLGKNSRILKSNKMPEEFYRNLWSTINSGSKWKGDFRNRKKNGDIYWERASISPVTSQDGRIVNFVAVMEDITLQKQINDELKAAKEAAEAATKIKSNFLANMSHEIRTPMNAIIGMSYLLEQTDLSGKQEDYLGKIRRSSENLLGLINDILDISKIEAGKLEIETIDFDLNYVFEKLFTIISLKVQEKGLELVFESAGDVPVYLRGDPLRLGQILLNLAGNAVKFTESGKIVISTELISKDSDSVLIQFSVKDEGRGMTEKHMSKLFKPFSQADSSTTRLFGGTGLGLAISKGLIDKMRGKIWVESKSGKGSTFYFTIKLGIQIKRTYSVIKGICNYVLVVSSDEVSENILRSYLEDFKCKSVFLNPEKVFEKGLYDSDILRNENPDLIILENPASSSICVDVAKEIRSVHILDSVPVIVISDNSRIKEIQMSLSEGEIDLFLTRPVSQSTLHDTIVRLLERKERRVSVKKAKFPAIKKDLDAIREARILLVEDNELNTQIAKEFLEQEGFIITTAVNGEDALNKILDPEDFNLVLMDLQMPVMDGYKAAKLIRRKKRFKDLPVLAMTADAVSGAREKVINAGMDDYITKPFAPEDVLKALIKWIKPESIRKAEKAQVNKYAADDFRILSLEGIDTESGVKRIGGNLNSYIRILNKFTENYKNFGYQFNNMDNEEERIRLVHSLKGVSGNIGANQLHEAVINLEKGLKEKQIKKIPTLVNKVMARMEIIINSVSQLDKSIKSDRLSPEVEIIQDTEEIKRQIKKLKEYLDTYDSYGIDFFDEIKTSLENIGFKENTKLIRNYLGKYDFDNALAVLTGIEGELNDR